MKRLPEPELMQGHLQVKAYSEADFSKGDESLVRSIEEYLLKKDLKVDSKSVIVDLGCGPGNITEYLHAKWPWAEIFGIDGSEPMLAIARRRSSGSGFPDFRKEIRYCCWDISLIADGSVGLGKTANLIVSNSLLHHIQNPHKFWETLKALSSKGTVHFHRDLRRPSSLNEAIDLQKTYLENSPQVLVNDYLASLQASFTVAEVKSQLRNEALDQLNVFEVEDRYLDVVGIF